MLTFGTMDMNNLLLIGVALLNAFTAYMTFLAKKDTEKTMINMQKVELATNSMKDALVASTAKSSYAEGATQAREAGEAKAAAILEGEHKAAALVEGELVLTKKITARTPPPLPTQAKGKRR